MKTAAWTSGILGLWIVLAAFLGLSPAANFANDLVVGIGIIVTGSILARTKLTAGWTVVLAGVWLFFAGFFPGLDTGAGLVWNNVLAGLAVAAAAFAGLHRRYAIAEIRVPDQPHHAAQH